MVNFDLPSLLSCSQREPDKASVRMASYKRLSPEDVHLSSPALVKEPPTTRRGFSVSLYVAL